MQSPGAGIQYVFRRRGAIPPRRHAGLLVRHVHLRLPALARPAPRRGHEVHEETQDVEEEDERDDPFQDGGGVVLALCLEDAECGCEGDFDEDEGEFDPEAVPQDAVVAEMYAEPLVLPADEYGGDDVAADEKREEGVVLPRVVRRVEDGEQDESCGAGDGKHDAEPGVELLPDGSVGRELACVPEVPLEDEGEVEGYDCYRGHGYEQGF